MRGPIVRLVALLAFAIAALPATAGDYRSSFGFGISVPDSYLVLTRDEVRKHADLFLEAEGQSRFEAIPRSMREAVYERVTRGQLEIFYRTEDVDFAFVDNVNVMRQRAALPRDESQLREVCRLLPGEFSRMFGRPIGLDGCEMRSVAGRRALYLSFDGAMPGTKTLQYQIEQDRGDMLVLTATATNASVARMLGEFEGMVASIRVLSAR